MKQHHRAQTLLILFGPWLLPRMLAFYRSIRHRPPASLKPLPKSTSYVLWILFFSGLVAFVSTLPAFAPENIFRSTSSRLQTPGSVLLTRLKALRPLTEADLKLKSAFDAGGLDAVLLYCRLGPTVLTEIPFEQPGEWEYYLYALPSLLTPHILHLFALGVATSGSLAGREGARWRTVAIISGVMIAAAELWYVLAGDHDVHNARATRLSELNFVHWKMRTGRGLLIAAFDGLLGWIIWLQATGRAFVTPPSPAERLLEHGKVLEGLLMRSRGLSVIRNGALRDAGLRAQMNDYWVKEVEVYRDAFEDPEVLEAQRAALRRLDMSRLSRDADAAVEGMLAGVQVVKG